MEPQLYIDLARYAHILAVAVGFGAAFLTDMHVIARLGKKVDGDFISSLHIYHKTISYSVTAMWVTGLIMIYIRTGFELANFSPKLFSKLVIVSVLTLNARFIGKVVMPMIDNMRGQSLLLMPVATQLKFAVVGALSTSSWLLAMLLGTSKVLAASEAIVFLIGVPFAYGCALIGAGAAVALMQRYRLSAAPKQATSDLPSNATFDASVNRAFSASAAKV
jgi:hypothetical protein